VLESLVKTGIPSRAEITDAFMGSRTECVMLNKGAFILDGLKTLDQILITMSRNMNTNKSNFESLQNSFPELVST
jgi:pyruvate kinase